MPLIQRHDATAPRPSEITPRALWEDRRRFLAQAAGLGSIGLAGTAWAQPAGTVPPGKLQRLASTRSGVAGAIVGAEKVTRYEDVSSYNNFYEFSTDKQMPARLAGSLKPRPWTITVEGEVKRPRSFDLDELLKLSAMEERIYRHRCVEGWSMVIPWVGWSLSQLLQRVEPTGNAKFVQFFSLADKAQMPGLASGGLDWPYTEGLRMDEAMHPLTLMAMGLYGEVLPNQNGAPIRLVVPWKYGFKGAKSIVRIRLVEKQPVSSWERAGPREYGFYSNVNPDVDHPRWSQASERRIGEEGGLFAKRRPTLMFNGYEPQVGQLYAGMDLRKYF